MIVQFPPIATPSGKYIYALGYDQPHFSGALWSMSITGTKGELTAQNGYYPGDFAGAANFTGFVMDGKGRFFYVSYPGLNGQWFLQPFVIDSATGHYKFSASFVKTYDVGILLLQATDPAGKYLYAYGNSPHGPEIFVYSIDPVTGVLTEISGSPFPIDYHITDGRFLMSPSGKFLYAYGSALDQSNLLWPAIYIYSIDGTTGIPTQTANSPIIMRSSGGVPKLSPTGNLLYMPERFVDDQGNVSSDIGVFKVNQIDGSISTSSVSSVPTVYSTFYPDPSGKVLLIGPGGTNYLTMWSYLVDDSTGTLTPAQGSPFFATDASVSQQEYYLVKIP
jgi:6-phosphogluconolactonase (cycloisomerase 2 family)